MRQRKVKNEAVRLEALSYLQIKNSRNLRGKWLDCVKTKNPDFEGKIYLELGCGRGHFLNAMAEARPEDFFIGVEGRSSVVFKALELTRDTGAPNLLFIPEFILHMESYFGEGELDGIYLNFSDPWPKVRHQKRRLTHRDYLLGYKKALKEGGFIEVKTDSEALYEFTLSQCLVTGFDIDAQSRDLHKSDFAAKEITTQYERRFMLLDKPIYYLKIRP